MNHERITNYTVIDVETPSSSNDSICSIGLVHVENNLIVSEEYYLINPECSFDRINMDIHKISKAMVIDKPTFPEIWKKISKYFINGKIVAHNAAFDLNVIGKTLNLYKLQLPEVHYICTLELARCTIDAESYRLENICNCLDIELINHHNALSDAVACQKIFNNIVEKKSIMARDFQVYQFNNTYIKKADKSILIKSLSALYGIVTGVTSDSNINDSELKLIEKWICEYDKFSETYPYNIINPLIKSIISNKTIITMQKEELINISRQFMPMDTYSTETLSMQILMGILEGISCDGEITLQELDTLKQWMVDNMHLKGNYPFDTIFITINKVIEDRIVTFDESEELIELFNEFLNPIKVKNETCLNLSGKKVCLTGNFIYGSKDEIGGLIIKNGGEMSSGVTKKTSIVVVGGEGSKDWSYGNFGTKVKKAMELKSNGLDIEIIREEDLFNLIGMSDSA